MTETDPGRSRDLDKEADELLRDIEDAGELTSSFVLRTTEHPEDLDPSDMNQEVSRPSAPAVAIEEDESVADPVVVMPDEPARHEGLHNVQADEESEEEEEDARLHRRHLRNLLLFAIIVLAIIAATIGVFIWHNSIAPSETVPDTEALATNSAGANATSFEELDASYVPEYASFFGKTLDEISFADSSSMFFSSGESEEASDADIPSMKSIVDGSLLDEHGAKVASVQLGFDADGKVVYVYALYDLDAVGVADADFREFANESTVPKSLLKEAGLADVQVKAAKVTLSDEPSALVSDDDKGKQECVFAGDTGLKDGPTQWELTETYAQSTGSQASDNRLMRTMLLELW